MDFYQTSGNMVVTNKERLEHPRYNAYADMFKAMMDNNLMDFRLLKNGVAELNESGPANRPHMSVEAFVVRMKAFLEAENIAELKLVGHFTFIETQDLQPVLFQVVVEGTELRTYTGDITWNIKA